MLIASVVLLTLYVLYRIVTSGDTDGLVDASGAVQHIAEF
jgi:acyl-CoA-binding protein